jgi:hypothetical protein
MKRLRFLRFINQRALEMHRMYFCDEGMKGDVCQQEDLFMKAPSTKSGCRRLIGK